MKKMRRFIALLMSVLFLVIGMTPNTLFAEDERCRRVIKFSVESADIDKDDNETDNDKSDKTNDTEIMPASGEENGEESFDKDNAPWDEKHTDGWDYVMSHNIDGYYYFQFFNADGTLYDSGFFSQVGGLDLNCICIDADLNSGLDGYEFDIEKTDWNDPELCKVTYYALHNYGYADARRVICHYLRSKGRENNTHMPDFSDAVEAALNSSIPEDIRFSVSYLRNCAYPGNSGRYQDFMTWRESRIIKNDYYAAVRKTDGRNAGMSGVSFDVFIDGEFIGKIVTGADGIGSIKVGSFENAPTVTVKENWVEGYGDGHARFSHNTEVKTAGVYTTLQEALQHASEFTYVNYSYGYGTLVKRSSSTTYTESFKGIKYALFRNDGTRIADVEMGDDGKISRVLKIYDTSKHFEEDVTYGGVKYKCIGGLRYDPNNKNNENNKYYWQEYETNEYYELDAETKVFFVMDDEYSTRPGPDASKYPLIYEVHPSISYATDKPYMDYYIAVKKVDEKGNTMAGVSFDVTINGVKKEKAVTTGGDGIAVYKVGSYTAVPRVIVTENWEDKRFIYNKSSKSVTAYKTAEAARNHAASFTYTNYAYGYATLVKESGRTGMKPSMAGIEYELRKSNGTRIAVVTLGDDGKIKKVSFVTSSDAFFTEKIDGKICIGGLNFKHGDGTNDNNYYWIETKTNEYYEINSRRYYFTINEENTVSPGSDITKYPLVTVINPAVTKAVDRPFLDYYVAVMKTDETGRKMNGVTFDITVNGKTYKKALVSGMEIKNGIKTEKNDGIAVYCLGRYVSAPEVSITENWSDEEYIHNTETKKVIAYSALEAARSHAEKYIYKNVRYTYTSLEKIPEDDTFLAGNDNYSLDNVMYGLYREEDQKLIAVVKLTQYEKNGKILAGIRSLDDITVKGGKPFYKKTHGGFNSVGGLTAGESYYWQELEDSADQPDGESRLTGKNYLYNPEKYSFTADSREADAPKVVTAVDRAKTGSITVVKKLDPDDIPGMSPAGAKYRIKGIDDFNKDYEDYFVIKEDGSSDVKKLIFGRYLIEEVDGPENGRWLLDENKYIVELTGGAGDKVLVGDSDVEDESNEMQKESGEKDDGKKTGDEAAEDPENIQVELNVKAENATVISTDRIIKDKYYIAVSKQNDAGEAMEGVSFEAEIKETGEKIQMLTDKDGIASCYLGEFIFAPEVMVRETWEDRNYIINETVLMVKAYTTSEEAREKAIDNLWINERLTAATIVKYSSESSITDDNPNYDLTGIIYGLFDDEDNRIAEVKIKEEEGRGIIASLSDIKILVPDSGYHADYRDGYYVVAGLKRGATYYWQEQIERSVEAGRNEKEGQDSLSGIERCMEINDDYRECGKGYILSEEKIKFTTTEENTVSPLIVTAKDEAFMGSITVHKTLVSKEIQGTSPKGAEYEVTGNEANNKDFREVLVIKEDGYSESLNLPLGSYRVKEIKGPDEGQWTLDEREFLIDITVCDGRKSISSDIRTAARDALVESVDKDTFYEVRADIAITKKERSSGENLAGVNFRIISEATGEMITVVTDDKGYWSSASDYALHSHDTNSGRKGAGTWFYGTDKVREIDDAAGAFPEGIYRIEEVVPKEMFKGDVKSITMKIGPENDGQLIAVPVFNDCMISVKTRAHDALTLSELSEPSEKGTLVDEVSLKGTVQGEIYTLLTRLISKEDGKVLAEKAISFTAKGREEQEVIEIETNTVNLAGKEVVFFEYLFKGNLVKDNAADGYGDILEKYAGMIIGKHEDINDAGQTIKFPKVNTSVSSEDGSREVQPIKNVTVYDEVMFSNLTAEREYKVRGILMDKYTGKPVEIDGRQIVSEQNFTADESSGSIRMVFTFDATDIEGHDVVVFEKIYDTEGRLLARHEDIDYLPQTFRVTEQPHTGDGFSLMIPVILMLVSAAGILYLIRRKTRRMK